MCAPISDGSAAAVLCSADALAKLGAARRRSRCWPARRAPAATARRTTTPATSPAASRAKPTRPRASAPADIDVAEVHDAASSGEIVQVEALGLCAPGEGGPAAERGETRLGGRIPVNTSGGLVSKGHPLGATGLGQVFELVAQLRGDADGRQVEGARIALAENSGGFYGVEDGMSAVTMLGRR